MRGNQPNKHIFGVLLLIIIAFVWAFWPHSVTRKFNFSWKDGHRKSDGEEPSVRLSGDNHPYQYKRQNPFQHKRQLNELGKLVQSRLHILQNPLSCNTRRKIKCLVNGCGLGCQVNTVSLCLMLGYALNRTVVLEPPMTSIIQPLSTTCTSADGENSKEWGEDFAKFQVVEFRIRGVKYRPEFFPPAVPDDLSDRITRMHRDPFLWWAGQISSYVLRPTKATSEFLKKEECRLGLYWPIVGVHIRRTDKLTTTGNTTYHAVEEYMVLVGKWYDELEKSFPRVSRRVFLATDSPGAKQEINMKYPEYTILNNDNYTQSAVNIKERKTDYGKLGILHDVHMLSKCDYVICTFSSNRSRKCCSNVIQEPSGSHYYSISDMQIASPTDAGT